MNILFEGLRKLDLSEDQIKAEKRAELKTDLKPFLIEDPEMQSWLSEINFPLVQKIFSRDYVKSGGNTADLRLVPKTDFILTNNQGYLHLGTSKFSVMMFLPQTDVILINVDAFQDTFRKNPKINRKVLFLEQFFHEEGHYAQSNVLREVGDDHVRAQVGLHTQEVKSGNAIHSHWFFNEAINELRARHNTLEYIVRNKEDVPESDLQWLSDPYAYPQPDVAFSMAIHILDEISIKLSEKLGVPKDVVLNSWIHAGYNGLVLSDKETKRTLNLDSYFKRGFSNDLAELQMAGDAQKPFDFMDKYDLKVNRSRFREMFRKAQEDRNKRN